MNVYDFAAIIDAKRAALRDGIPDEQPFVPYNETDPASASTLERGPEHRQPVVEVPHV